MNSGFAKLFGKATWTPHKIPLASKMRTRKWSVSLPEFSNRYPGNLKEKMWKSLKDVRKIMNCFQTSKVLLSFSVQYKIEKNLQKARPFSDTIFLKLKWTSLTSLTKLIMSLLFVVIAIFVLSLPTLFDGFLLGQRFWSEAQHFGPCW